MGVRAGCGAPQACRAFQGWLFGGGGVVDRAGWFAGAACFQSGSKEGPLAN